MKDKSEKFRIELAFLRDNLITAIRDQKTGTLDDLLGLYRALVETFIKKLKQLGADYDMAATFKESQSFGREWPEIRWLDEDIQEMIDEAVNINNQNILRKVIYFPISLAHIALIEKDYYTYTNSLKWVPYLISRISSLQDLKAKKSAIDLISLHLRELADFYIGHLIKTSQDKDEIRRLRELAAGSILTFNSLLKLAYDNNDADSFKIFLSRLDKLFEYVFQDVDEYDIEVQQKLANKDLMSAAEKEAFENKISIAKAILETGQHINTLRNQLRFGLQSWIVNEFESKKILPEVLLAYYKELANYGNMMELTETYFSCIERTTSDIFGWSFWELAELEGQAGWLNTDMHHSKLYCLKALELLQNITSDQTSGYEIPERHSLVFRSEELFKILIEIEQNRGFWEPLIGVAAINAVPIFQELIKKAVERQKEKELNTLITADLDPVYIETFKKDILKGWREHATARWIVKQFGRYKEEGLAPKDTLFFGINIADRKDVYVKDTDLYKKDWGIEHGRNLGSGESTYVSDMLLKRVSAMAHKDRDDKLGLVNDAIDELRNNGYVPNVILLFNAWSVKHLMESSGKWTLLERTIMPRGQVQGGYYKDIFVHDLHRKGERGIAVIADLRRLGIWKQYEPRQLISGEERLDVFSFLIRKYDMETAEQLLVQNAGWLKDSQTGKQRTRDEALREILQRVHLRVVEQYDYEMEDPKAGLKVNLGKEW